MATGLEGPAAAAAAAAAIADVKVAVVLLLLVELTMVVVATLGDCGGVPLPSQSYRPVHFTFKTICTSIFQLSEEKKPSFQLQK